MILVFSFAPFPSQVTLFPAGYMISKGELIAIFALVFSVIGAVIGATINYIIGRKGGRALLLVYGKKVGIRRKVIRTADKLFAKYGEYAVVIGLLIPGVGQFISIPAGSSKMNFFKFMLSIIIGSTTWIVAMMSIGYVFGENVDIDELLEGIPVAELAMFVSVTLLALFVVYKIVKEYRDRSRE